MEIDRVATPSGRRMALPPVDRRQCLWGTPQTASADKRIFRLGVRHPIFQGFFAVYFLVYCWARFGIFCILGVIFAFLVVFFPLSDLAGYLFTYFLQARARRQPP